MQHSSGTIIYPISSRVENICKLAGVWSPQPPPNLEQGKGQSLIMLVVTSIEESLKISASGRNFLHPSPPYSKKGPTDKNVGILYLIVIIKFSFFEISTPPISPESRTSPIFTNEVAPKLA